MIRTFRMRRILAVGIAGLVTNACATAAPLAGNDLRPVGLWASGKNSASCETAPLTYFSSDGVVLVMLSPNGPVHSFGKWDHSGGIVSMTHNDFPLKATGQANQSVDLEVITLNETRFITRNAKGDIRERVKCNAVELRGSSDDGSH